MEAESVDRGLQPYEGKALRFAGTTRDQLVLGLASASAFVSLIFLVQSGATHTFDLSARSMALALNTPMTVQVWKLLTFLGSTGFLSCLLFLALAYLAAARCWAELRLALITAAGAVVLDIGAKLIIHRPRPPEVYANTMPASFSFPSGHAFYNLVFYVTMLTIMGRLNPKLSRVGVYSITLAMPVVIGASRVFLGVHYMTDVLGGYLMAIFWIQFARVIFSTLSE